MSIDLADILAHQFATPAPTAADPPTRPGEGNWTPGGPWKPGAPSITDREYRAWLDSLTTDELVEHLRAGCADVHTTIARHGRAAA